MQNEAIFLIEKLLNYYNLTSLQELAEKLNIKQSSLSSWKSRNSINAIRNKCRELGIYNEIFGDLNSNTSNFQNSTNVVAQDFSNNSNAKHKQNIGNQLNIDENILKLIDTLYSFAKTNNKIDELKTDLSALLPKYM
ncbi:helix-turn-helix domain containing protein [Aliarcobacter cryaerophilus]|uniref:helix-turn-helix domain containing protein n=1 Tax=Aliarcobacter cryaerophilus TaxID=28198 RepID=UPI0021B608FB|nr:helix-turn-helix domain containing protein [Aliarcobacter cryaerophilus]MCT7462096.1 helix-turn-helix domain containing protein [Aliarcobacter cryaerophilus]